MEMSSADILWNIPSSFNRNYRCGGWKKNRFIWFPTKVYHGNIINDPTSTQQSPTIINKLSNFSFTANKNTFLEKLHSAALNSFTFVMSSCLCVGPRSSGKTMLLNSIQYPDSVDFTTHSVNTVGTNLYTITNPESITKKKCSKKNITIRELGGEMAVMWKNYYTESVEKILFVVDTSNLCQISCAGELKQRNSIYYFNQSQSEVKAI